MKIQKIIDLHYLLAVLEYKKVYSQKNDYKVYGINCFSNKGMVEILEALSKIRKMDVCPNNDEHIPLVYFEKPFVRIVKGMEVKIENVHILNNLPWIVFNFILQYYKKEAIQFVEALESFKKRRDGYLYFESREFYQAWRKDLIEKESEEFHDFISFLSTSNEELITSPTDLDIVNVDINRINNIIDESKKFDFKKMN